MTRKEYCDAVLSCLRRLTPEEKHAVQAEIDGHIEDHICALLELGYDEQLAEERTMALMGDPVEVGREMDKQYPSRIWSRLEWIACLLFIILVFQMITGLGILFHARDYVMARVVPERKMAQSTSNQGFESEVSMDADVRISVGNDILRVYQVSVGKRPDLSHTAEPDDRIQAARVALCAYDRIPFGIVSGELHRGLTLLNQRGEKLDSWSAGTATGSTGSYGAAYMSLYTAVEPEDTYVTLAYDRFGEMVTVDVPLPEVMS